MGIFDAFTGKPAKQAAAANRALYNSNLTSGLDYLTTGKTEGLDYLTTGKKEGTEYLDKSIAAFDPLITLGQNLGAKYGSGTSMYLDAMGVNGPEGVARAQAAFQTGPGYQFAVDQGQKALARQTSAGGTPASGAAMMAAQKYGVGMANQEYGNWLKNFQNFISPEMQAAGIVGTGTAGQATGYANQAQLTASDAASRAQITGGDAVNRVNLGNTTTAGLANTNNTEASAKMAASGNLLNFGMNLAKLATGLPGFGGFGGGTSHNAG